MHAVGILATIQNAPKEELAPRKNLYYIYYSPQKVLPGLPQPRSSPVFVSTTQPYPSSISTMPRSASTSTSSLRSYYIASSDYDTPDDYYSNIPTTSADLRSRAGNPGTWPPRSKRTDPRISERTTRGYNPSYYGDIAPIAGSSPDLRTMADVRDPGYRVETADTPPLDTPMGTRYRQYKSYDADAYEAEQEYKQRLKDVPKAPNKKRRGGNYRGNPPMIPSHHQQMASYADNMVDVTRSHVISRSEYDHDYIGHYPSKAYRKGHTDRIMNEDAREERLWSRKDDHRQYGFGEDEISQIEAKEERIRAREERYKRMGYERRDEDNRR